MGARVSQNSGKLFSGNYCVKFWHFSGKNHAKLGNFVNFSGKYHKNWGTLINLRSRIMYNSGNLLIFHTYISGKNVPP